MHSVKKALVIILALCLLLCTVGCKGNTDDPVSSTDSSSVSDSGTAGNESAPVGKILSTDVWEPVPFVSKELRDMGFEGGEGCQASATIVFDPVDGKVAYFGTDVGGVFKSTDGGKTWTPSNYDLDACGANHICFDPNNIDRVLLVGCNSGYHSANGLYLTEDGERWDYVFKA